MGRGRGNKELRRERARERAEKARQDRANARLENFVAVMKAADRTDGLRPLSPEGRNVARGVARMERIEEIRRA